MTNKISLESKIIIILLSKKEDNPQYLNLNKLVLNLTQLLLNLPHLYIRNIINNLHSLSLII